MFLAVLTPPTRRRALTCLPTLPRLPGALKGAAPDLAAAFCASSHHEGYSGMEGATNLQGRGTGESAR